MERQTDHYVQEGRRRPAKGQGQFSRSKRIDSEIENRTFTEATGLLTTRLIATIDYACARLMPSTALESGLTLASFAGDEVPDDPGERSSS